MGTGGVGCFSCCLSIVKVKPLPVLSGAEVSTPHTAAPGTNPGAFIPEDELPVWATETWMRASFLGRWWLDHPTV